MKKTREPNRSKATWDQNVVEEVDLRAADAQRRYSSATRWIALNWFLSWTVGPVAGWLVIYGATLTESNWKTRYAVRIALGILWPALSWIVFIIQGISTPGMWTNRAGPALALALSAAGIYPAIDTYRDYVAGPREATRTITRFEEEHRSAIPTIQTEDTFYSVTFDDGSSYSLSLPLRRKLRAGMQTQVRWLEHSNKLFDARPVGVAP